MRGEEVKDLILSSSPFTFHSDLRSWPRPLAALTLSFIMGMVTERFGPSVFPRGWIAGITSVSVFFLFTGFRISFFRSVLFILLLFFMLGFTVSRLAAPVLPFPSSLDPFFNRPDTLFLAEVKSPPDLYPDNETRLSLRLLQVFTEGKKQTLEGGVLLTLRETQSTWFQGDRVLLRLTLKHFHNFNNPGGYDYERAQAEKGLYARAHLPDDRLLIRLAPESRFFCTVLFEKALRRLDAFRQKSLTRLQTHLDDRYPQRIKTYLERNSLPWLRIPQELGTDAFYAAMLLGYRHQMSPLWKEHLNRAGVSHLLAISGLHLGLVSVAVFWVMRSLIRFLIPGVLRRISDQYLALFVVLFAVASYALISGLALPTWRAGFMLFLCSVALWVYRAPDASSVLAAAALGILLIEPNSLWSASFQLSFAAIFGIFYVYPYFRKFELLIPSRFTHPLFKILRPFEHAFWISLSVNIVVLPLTAYHFHGFSLAGLMANAVLVPVIGFTVLPPGLLSLALFPISEHLALPILLLGGWILHLCQYSILWFSRFSWSFVWVGIVPLTRLAGFYGGLIVLLHSWQWRRKALALLVLAILAWGFGALTNSVEAHAPAGTLQVNVVDVGQGSAALIRFPTGETMLVDGGGFFDDSFDVGHYVLAPFLWHSGIRELDYVVLSHDHPDHRNGLRFILASFKVGQFWENTIKEETSDNCTSLGSIATFRNIPVLPHSEVLGDHAIGSCQVRVLHPSRFYLEEKWDRVDLNDVSLVIQIDYKNTHVILPGDIERPVEHFLFGDISLPGKVLLIAPHHGSRSAGSDFLLDHIHPQSVVFSCGYENRFGFPSPEVLKRCAQRKIPIYRTDLQGAIQAVSDGNQWKIYTNKN